MCVHENDVIMVEVTSSEVDCIMLSRGAIIALFECTMALKPNTCVFLERDSADILYNH